MSHNSQSDPNNAFHELRRFLVMLGISSRLGSFNSCPLPSDLQRSVSSEKIADNWFTTDNYFIFELRRIYKTDAGVLNAVAFVGRVFFEDGQNGEALQVQLVCNHRGHGTLEMTQAYNDIIEKLLEQEWTLIPYASNVLGLEKRFGSIHHFKRHFMPLYRTFKAHGVINTNQLTTEPQG
jgi:hypothetical protein